MLKRAILLFVVISSAGLLLAGYFFLARSFTTGTDPLKAVADDAVLIVRAGSATGFLSAVNNNEGLWQELDVVFGGGLARGAQFLDSLFANDTEAGGLAEGKSFYMSVHPTGRNNYDVLFYLALESRREADESAVLIDRLLSPAGPLSERVFERVRIHSGSFDSAGRKRSLSWALSDGLLITGFSPLLVENAVAQLASGTPVVDDDAFQRVFATSGLNVDANIYVNLELFPGYISSFSEGEGKRLLENYSGLANWAELDLHLRDNIILLNGFSYSAIDDHNYLDLFRGQSSVELAIESVIPGGASAFLALGLSNTADFLKGFEEWAGKGPNRERHYELALEFTRLTGKDHLESFLSFMEGEVALVMSDWEDPAEEGDFFLVLKTSSRTMARDALLEMLGHNAGSTGRDIGSYRNVYSFDRDRSFDIFSFPFDHTGELLFGRVFGLAGTSFFTFADNYLVFGSSVSSLSGFIHANELNQTIAYDTGFRDFSRYRVDRNNLFLYSNLARSGGLLTGLFNQDISNNIINNINSVRKFRELSLQFSSGREMIYNNIFLGYSPEVVEEPQTEWQTLLDTIIDFKPLLLVNHHTGENEIFVQDLNNTIYLINNAGRILWKKPLSGKIMGTVYQIDYYNNNRLQMLFNTADRIYLLDRNGNDVDRYPVRLPSPATNGLALFDYDNNRNYRIFIAGEDRSVSVRSKEGNIISGWNFPGSDHQVVNEIQHFRADGRDYIVFADRQRVYILDRRGNVRVKPDILFPVSRRNNLVFEGRTPASDARLVLSDTTGKAWHVYFDGKTEPVSTGNYSAGHWFDFQDVNADGYRDYIFLDNDRLDVWSRDGSLMFRHQFDYRVDHPPAYYHFSRQDRKLGVLSAQGGVIYLVNAGGDIYNGFPLRGRSPFTIGPLSAGRGNFHLIVGSDNNFLYNYIVY